MHIYTPPQVLPSQMLDFSVILRLRKEQSFDNTKLPTSSIHFSYNLTPFLMYEYVRL